MATKTPENVIEAKREEVRKLHALELDMSREQVSTIAEAMQADATAGSSLLDDRLAGRESSGDAQSAVARAWDRVAALGGAIAEARDRRATAIRAVGQAEAAALRTQADALEAEAEDRSKRTERLLRELEEFEGVSYVPAQSRNPQVARHLDAGTARVLQVTTIRQPRTDALRAQARSLRTQADQIERRAVPMGGVIRAANREDLVIAVEQWPSEKIAPLRSAVDRWALESETALRERIRRREPSRADEPFGAYVLAWANGEINEAGSSVALAGE